MPLRLADMPDWPAALSREVRERYFGNPDGWLILDPHSPRLDPRADQTYTYVLQGADSGNIKIGTTRNLRSRLPSLRTSCSEALHVVAILDGRLCGERALHHRFRQQRIRGEWFRPAKRLLTAVAQMARRLP